MSKWQEYTKTWIDEVPDKQEQAYRNLIASLIDLIKEQDEVRDLKVGVEELGDEDIDTIIGSIPDMSGKYIKLIGKYQVEVSKEEEETGRMRLSAKKKDDKVQHALNEYFNSAKDLCQYQAIYMMKVEKLH